MSLTCLALGAAAFSLGPPGLRTGSLLVFCLLGIGSAPWQLDATLRLPTRLALSGLTGVGVLTLVSTVMLSAGAWYPAASFAVVAALVVPCHLLAIREARGVARPSMSTARPRLVMRLQRSDKVGGEKPATRHVAPLLAVTGLLLCLAAALTHRHIDPGIGGFLVDIGPLWFAGLALVLVGVAAGHEDEESGLALAVLILLVVLTLTPALVYDGPRSQSAAKHVELVQQIRLTHKLQSSIAIYNGWPGFFAALAWLCDITGIRDPLRLAAYWPPLVGLLRLVGLRYLFGQVLRSRYQRWGAVALAILADPLGADYFSPQSVGFVLGIVAFGLALSRNRTSTRTGLLLLAGCTLAVTHQLSPFVVGGVLVVLAGFRQVRPWWTPLLVLGPAFVWAAAHYSAVRSFISFGQFGNPSNFRPPSTIGSAGLQRLPIVRETVAALVLGILVVGAVAAVSLLRSRRSVRSWALACSPAVGLSVVAVNPYGQEGIFRAVLFGMPWLVVLAAMLLPAVRRLSARLPVLALLCVLQATFLVAAFGLDSTNVIRPGDVSAFRYFQAEGGARPSSTYWLLNLGVGDLPSAPPTQQGTHRSVGRAELGVPVRQETKPQPDALVQRLTTSLLKYTRQPRSSANLYALWSPVSSDYMEEYALQRPDQFAALRDAFSRAPDWQVAYQKDGTVLFHFAPST